MRRGRLEAVVLTLILAVLILFVIIVARPGRAPSGESVAMVGSGEKVGLVEVLGPIYDARPWIRDLDRFARRPSIRAIVLRLDSPGGGVAASQELYQAVRRAAEQKPVVVSMGSVATSGAYYAALGADSIIANPGTTTGSIGVLLELLEVRELMQKVGVQAQVIRSGRFKDAGNPARELTDEERALFQDYIDDAFDQFVGTVTEVRNLTDDQVRTVSDGRVFTGRRALELGLVDRLGDQHEAVITAGRMAGIDGRPTVVRPPKDVRFAWLDALIGRAMDEVLTRMEGSSPFQYRWQAETLR